MSTVPDALKAVLRPLRRNFRALAYYSLFINMLALATPVFVLQVYDRVVFHSGMSTLQGLAAGMVLAIAFDFMLRQARSRLMQAVSLRIDVALGKALFDKICALPLRILESRPAAHWQVLFRDAEQVRNMLGGPNAVLLVDLPFVVLFIALIYIIAAPVVWVLLTALAAFLGLALWSSHSIRQASGEERRSGLSRDSLISEIVMGRTTVKALAAGESMRPEWEGRHADGIETALRRGRASDTFGNLGVGFTVATTVAMTVVGALAILDQRMSIGALIAANMLSARIVSPLNQLVAAWRNFGAYRESAKRLSETFALDEEPTVREVEFDRPNGVIALEKVGFVFDEAAGPVVDGLNFAIKPGGLHGVVGRNGSGKSTMLKLMQGLYAPSTGRVLLDGADIRQFTRTDLARWFGYVAQECVLFSGSIRDNIAKGLPGARDDEIIAVARLVGVHDEIVDLPDGYGTDIGEAGSRLSAGQRQKIVIARALIGDPPILLLDEPTSNLDRPAEEKIRSVLRERAQNRNVVIVSHSPIMLSACNNLIVLDKGRIAMAGAASDIMPRLFGGQGTPPRLERKA